MVITGRTDLASEARSSLLRSAEHAARLKGIRAEEETLFGLSLTAVEILDDDAAALLGKDRGKYYTLRLPAPLSRGDTCFQDAAAAISTLLRRCLPKELDRGILIAALGNPDVTPDALGSLVAGNLLVTRHLKRLKASEFGFLRSTVLCRTGVLGTTGLESADQIRAFCDEIHPACVIAVDALAGSELSGLCRSVQICNTGIAPGSGVGNDRDALNEASLGVPVLAVGVPTVIDASSLAQEQELTDLFVTPRFIDSAVRSVARVLAYGINLALHDGISVEDIDLLVG